MLEVLEFIFSGFWTFIGVWILLSVIVDGIVCIFRVFRKNCINDNSNKEEDNLNKEEEDGLGN